MPGMGDHMGEEAAKIVQTTITEALATITNSLLPALQNAVREDITQASGAVIDSVDRCTAALDRFRATLEGLPECIVRAVDGLRMTNEITRRPNAPGN